MVHLDPCGNFLARGLVVDHDLAGKQLGHAGGVVLDDEFLELNGEGQLLQHDAVGLAQDGGAGLRTLAHQQVAAKGGVIDTQPVLGFDIGNQPAAGVRRLAAQPHLRTHHQVAIEQAAQAHQHDGAVGGDVADLVGCTDLGRHHPAWACGGVTLLQLDLPASRDEQLAQPLGLGLGRTDQRSLRLVVKGLETLFADVFFVGFQVDEYLGRVAGNAQRGAGHQKSQDQQKPPRAIDRVELHRRKHIGPKRPELVDVIVHRLVLLEHRANDGGDANQRQQRDGKPHGRQQLHRSAQRARCGLEFNTLGGNSHGWIVPCRNINKKSGSC